MRRFLRGTKLRSLFVGNRRYGITYVLLFVGWIAANGPAFAQFWWHADDFTRAIHFDPWFSMGQGRPLEVIVPFLIHLDYITHQLWLHEAIRLLQAALHVLVALLLIDLFQGVVGFWAACSAVLFFLFWPFHGEAVLWVSALAYPLAAALSLCGLLILQRAKGSLRWLGAVVIVGAMFTNQAAAPAALVAWLIRQNLNVLQQNRLAAHWRYESSLLCLGYLSGAVASRALIVWVLNTPGRATLAGSVWDKVAFWLELNRQYFASPNYPPLLTLVLLMLPLLVAGLLLVHWWQRQLTWRQLGGVGLLMALLTITPYGVVLLAAESSPAWRILYLAPLFTVAIWLIGLQLLPSLRVKTYLSSGVLALFLAIVLPMNWGSAADYVNVFNADIMHLRQIEQTATSYQPPLRQVVVATYPTYLRTWDLYGVTYMHYDSKKSAFLRDWTVVPFVAEFSTLAPVRIAPDALAQEPTTVQACVTLCWVDDQQQPWQLIEMPDTQTLCVCP